MSRLKSLWIGLVAGGFGGLVGLGEGSIMVPAMVLISGIIVGTYGSATLAHWL